MKTVFKKISFVSMEKVGTVTCIIRARIVDNSSQRSIFMGKNIERDVTVSATANCHPGDKYDESIGKKVAEAKARTRLYNRVAEIEEKYLKNLKIYLKEVEDEISLMKRCGKLENKRRRKYFKNNDKNSGNF